MCQIWCAAHAHGTNLGAAEITELQILPLFVASGISSIDDKITPHYMTVKCVNRQHHHNAWLGILQINSVVSVSLPLTAPCNESLLCAGFPSRLVHALAVT